MKPAQFDYLRAETLSEVHKALAADPEARVIAGGQTLVPMLSMRLARPPLLIDIMRIAALKKIEDKGKFLRVGAAVRQAELLALEGLAEKQPLLAAALPWVGHAQTRNRGTVCGSVAHADPSAEIPLTLVALEGSVEVSGLRGTRRVPAAEFFTGLMTTARKNEEMIEAVWFPVRKPNTGYAFFEYGRRHGDFAIVAAAAVAEGDKVRLTIGGVADRPVARDFRERGKAALDKALNEFAWSLEARDDQHGTAVYRRELVRQIGAKVMEEARSCLN
ncbi:MAG TPA: FAD binding domain-containing protein [Xanthobacteraceae bacterium]|nr:FAD binding domain-containing protein [Xanthobacteraceae bacterium]